MAPSSASANKRRESQSRSGSSSSSSSSSSGSRASTSPRPASGRRLINHNDMTLEEEEEEEDDGSAFAPKYIVTPRTPTPATRGNYTGSGSGSSSSGGGSGTGNVSSSGSKRSSSSSRSRGRTPEKGPGNGADTTGDSSSSSGRNGGNGGNGGGGGGSGGSWSLQTSGLALPAVKMSLQLCLSALNVGCWLIPLQSQTFSSNTALLALASWYVLLRLFVFLCLHICMFVCLYLQASRMCTHLFPSLPAPPPASHLYRLYHLEFQPLCSYSAGVFLSLAITHLLPQSIDGLEALARTAEEKGNMRKLALVACMGGYLLVLWLEKVAFFSIHRNIEVAASSSGATANSTGAVDGEGDSHSAKVLLFAMSVHSLLETLALGLSKDTSAAVMMAASIGLHQPAETLALLVSFLKTGMSQADIIIYMSIFSVVGPVSVLLGIVISKTADPKLDSIIVAITAGTFIYMACTEIANEEFPEAGEIEGGGGGGGGGEVTLEQRYQRLAAIGAGIATILGLAHVSEGWEEK